MVNALGFWDGKLDQSHMLSKYLSFASSHMQVGCFKVFSALGLSN